VLQLKQQDDTQIDEAGPTKSFAIDLDCDLAHAEKLIYSAGIDLADPDTSVAIGAGCTICDWPACPQRAFPYVGRPVHVDPHTSTDLPYPPGLTATER
jgi:XRE family transcriptional regulator, fatty acid utilization regulator